MLTGGSDSMSACPYAVRDIRFKLNTFHSLTHWHLLRFGTKLGADPKLEDMMWASLTDMLSGTPMGVTAENLAVKFDVTRSKFQFDYKCYVRLYLHMSTGSHPSGFMSYLLGRSVMLLP